MTEQRFRRFGLDYRFAPAEVPVVLLFQRVKDNGEEVKCQVQVHRPDGQRVITRRVDLLAGPTRGATAELIKELHELNPRTPPELWRALMREAGESVIESERKGSPFLWTEGVIERPPPPAWLCQGLLLKNKANCWLGAASTGKSTLAKAMCAYYATGFRFCDRPMEQGVPLYLDWEDDRDSFNRTVYDVCQNLGVSTLPRMGWRDMHGKRLRDQLETLAQQIDREGVGLMVLDAVAAAGGSTGERMTWEAIALEMEECLGALPPVTVLALDHVTGSEHRAQRGNGLVKPPVPIKGRGSERKVEFFRNQWTLVPDIGAERLGRHVVEWTHTKCNPAPKETHPFATEIIHRPDEVSIVLRPLEQLEPEEAPADTTQTQRLLSELIVCSPQSPRELAWRLDGREPDRGREESIRKLLERARRDGLVAKEKTGGKTRYGFRQADDSGVLIPFPGSA